MYYLYRKRILIRTPTVLFVCDTYQVFLPTPIAECSKLPSIFFRLLFLFVRFDRSISAGKDFVFLLESFRALRFILDKINRIYLRILYACTV